MQDGERGGGQRQRQGEHDRAEDVLAHEPVAAADAEGQPPVGGRVGDRGDREGVLLRFRQTNRPAGQAGKDLVKATKKAFRSFRFGLDRP